VSSGIRIKLSTFHLQMSSNNFFCDGVETCSCHIELSIWYTSVVTLDGIGFDERLHKFVIAWSGIKIWHLSIINLPLFDWLESTSDFSRWRSIFWLSSPWAQGGVWSIHLTFLEFDGRNGADKCNNNK
jgi:hypothetical protein